LVLVQAILKAAVYRVVAAGSGEDAVRLAGQRYLHIDVALIEVRMPNVRPRELAGEILSLRPELPIVFMSGSVDGEIIRIRVMNDCAGFLPEPSKRSGLLGAVLAMESPRPTLSPFQRWLWS
jgi:two-component system cell cycle sensor histidine kinase/response regulator CckA